MKNHAVFLPTFCAIYVFVGKFSRKKEEFILFAFESKHKMTRNSWVPQTAPISWIIMVLPYLRIFPKGNFSNSISCFRTFEKSLRVWNKNGTDTKQCSLKGPKQWNKTPWSVTSLFSLLSLTHGLALYERNERILLCLHFPLVQKESAP